jgi:hypothetical protein
MGMFDWVKVDVPLPDGWRAPNDETFQTKDFESTMTTIWITPEGRLMVEDSDIEIVPEAERPGYDPATGGFTGSLGGLIGSIRHINHKWRDLNYHGWFGFYGSESPDNGHTGGFFTNGKRYSDVNMTVELPSLIWHEYRVKFTDGQLVEIVLDENLDILA